MRVESSKDERICYNIKDVNAANPKEDLEHLLLAHTFAECDTTSQTHNFENKPIFKKRRKCSGLQEMSKKSYLNSVTFSEIGNATI